MLHRKNALFYRTLHGAEVGDLFMSLIHTCELCGANSLRLPDRVAAARPGTDGQPRGVDALELPRDAGPEQNRAMRECAARRNWTVAMQVLGCIHRTGKPVTMKR